jgi:hypothetical protein
LVNFLAPGSGSAFPRLIRIRFQESKNKGGSMRIRIRDTVKKERKGALWLKMKQEERQLFKDQKFLRKSK